MYDLRSSPICRHPIEKEKPLSFAAMLFAVLVIMFLTSFLQAMVMVTAFFLTRYRALLAMSESAVRAEEIAALLQEFAQTDLCLLLQLFSTVATIALTLTLCICLLKRKPSSLALSRRGSLWQYLLGLVLGVALFSASFGVASINGAQRILGVASPVNVGMLVLLFFGYVIQAASEEILFRGFVMCDLARRSSPVFAVLISSLAFSLAHYSNTGIGFVALLNLFLFGVLASVLVLRTGSLLGAAALHTAWNFTQGHVFGCRVSGLLTESTVLHTEAVDALKLTNGGAFGPEGGVAVTVVLLVSIALFLVFPSPKNKSEAE